ncbi:MAG: efflux RND transporter permease subunit, partial [Propionibacteriaceae bacterium]|nr:efflux RND transporter permease subunit [Propionibacteriaceae bacterium]
MSRLTRVSLAYRTVVILLGLLAVIAGVYCTTALKQELIPSMELPRGTVIAVYPGASPEVVESEVSKPIEAAVQGVAGVTQVTSSSSPNVSQVTMQWDYDNNADDIVTEIGRAVADLSLPDGVNPRVITGGMDDLPVLIIAAASDDDLDVFSKKIDELVVPELKAVEGVRDIGVSGEEANEISVVLDQDEVQDKGVDQGIISTMFLANGMAIPAGTIHSGSGDVNVQVGETFSSVEEIENLLIQTADDPVRLGDIATIEEVKSEVTSVSRVNGRPSLTLSITKTLSGNTVSTAHGLRDKLDSLAGELGNGAEFKVIFDQSPFIEDSIRDLSTEGGIGLVMAIIVIMLFLWSVRPTLITAISIPLSLLIALIGLYVGGDSLNILTLGAMTVAIGRVVDDSIVIIENIKRHQSLGNIGRGSIVAAVKEVAGAVTSSTLTTVAVFLPIGLVGGQVGELFRPFAVTVTIALLASLVVSMTVVPVLASWFMRIKSPTPLQPGTAQPDDAPAQIPETLTWLQRGYLPVLNWALTHRLITLLISLALFGGTVALAPNLKTDFIGDMGQDMVQISMKFPNGTGLQDTDAAARRVEELLAAEPDIEAYQTTVGAASGLMGMMMGGSSSGDQASIFVTVKDGADSKPLVERLRGETAEMDGLGEVQIGTTGTTGASSQVVLYVESADPAKLEAGSVAVAKMLEGLPGLVNVNSDLTDAQPMLKVDLKEETAAKKGYTKATVGQAIQRAIRGQQLGTMTRGDSTIDVYLKSQQPVKDIDELRDSLLPVTQQMTMQARLDAADKVTKKSDQMTADAKDEGNKAFDKQLKQLQDAKSKAKKSVTALKKQLSGLNTAVGQLEAALALAEKLPPSPENPDITKAVLDLKLQIAEAKAGVTALEQGIKQAQAGVPQVDAQISALKKQRETALDNQDKQEALQEEAKDAQEAKAKPIKLSAIAEVSQVESPSKITRVDGVRAATVTASTESADLGGINSQLEAALEQLNLPDGVSVRIGGVSQQQAEAFEQLGLAMLVAIGVVYLVMVATFGSLSQPLILLVSIPFAATGALGLSLVTDIAIGVPSLIGMLMLIGIVVTNAIVLIDLINQFRKRGESVASSVMYGAALRVRPIVMTALATIFALLPMGLGLTGGSVFISKPLAIVVMGGLISSTLLTLILVPVIYDLWESWRQRRADRKTANAVPAPTQ